MGVTTATCELVGDVVFLNPVPGNTIQIRNFASSPSAIKVTDLPGGSQAQATGLIIQRLF